MSTDSDNLSINDFEKLCRTCLTEGDLKPLYEKCSNKVCLIEMLMSVSFIQVTENDGLPVHVCLNCETEIKRAYNFAQKCSDVDAKLRNCVKQFQNENVNLKTLHKTHTRKQTNKSAPNNFEIEIETENDIRNQLKENDANNFEIEVKTENYSINQTIVSDPNFEIEIKTENDTPESNLEMVIIKHEIVPENPKNIEDDVNDRNCDEKLEETEPASLSQFECKKCLERFPDFKHLKQHREEAKHPPRSYPKKNCKVCSKPVGNRAMKEHMRTHTREKPYCCEICGSKFSIGGNLKRHMLGRHSANKPYKCDQCDKGFTRLGILKDHQRVHTGEMPFVCKLCGKAFSQSQNFKTHMNRHKQLESRAGRPPGLRNAENRASFKYECEVCNERFNTKAILNNHKLVHGEKNFLCSYCGKDYFTQLALKSHLIVHTGVKPYSCDICGKKFSRTSCLNTHKRLHTGDKPFVCSICNSKFTQRHHLTYHMRTHSGEKPHTCTVCGKSFALNSNLKVHVRTHTGETPYLCPICGKGFYDSSSMKKHKTGCGKQNKIKVKSVDVLNAS